MPKKKYYTQFTDERTGLEVILENGDQDHPQIINRDAYRMFIGRLIQINTKYYERIGDKSSPEYAKNYLVNYKIPFDIDVFYRMNHRWLTLAQEYYKTKDDPTGLKEISRTDVVHSFDPKHFDLIKEAASDLFRDLADIAEDNRLGTPYITNNGEEELDYTEVVDDILELSLLATHAYTDIFNVLEGQNQFLHSFEKMTELARVMHNSYHLDGAHLNTKNRNGISGISQFRIKNPYGSMKNMFTAYNDKLYLSKYLDPRFSPFNKKEVLSPEEEAKRQEELRLMREQAEDEERKMREAIEEQIKEEARRVAAEEAEQRAIQTEEERIASLLERSKDDTKTITFVPNEENPSKINQAMYAYFDKFAERMGIDQSKFNAQSLIQAASIAFVTEHTRRLVEGESFDPEKAFLKDMYRIYKNVTHLTYDAYVQKCLNENRPLDLNDASKEVMDLMSVVVYTLYPTTVNGTKKDFVFQFDIHQIIRSEYGMNGIVFDASMREDAIERAKLEYLKKDDSFFTADAEARFEGFTTRKISSTKIVTETADIVNSYSNYKKNRADTTIVNNDRTDFGEANMRKAAMDAAYALERRIETRYGTRLSRFFRYFSYAKQRDELARVKGVLGIPNEQRVAEHMKSSRIKDLFVETNIKSTKQLEKNRANDVGKDPIAYLNKLLEKNLTKEEMPHITEQDVQKETYNRIHKYDQLTPAYIAYQEEQERKRREEEDIRFEKERELKEELERQRREEEEKERLRKEEEERLRKEEEERIRKEEEERLRKEEEQKRKEEEERIRKEEEEKEYIRQKLADRQESIRLETEDTNRKELEAYESYHESILKNKIYAEEQYNEQLKIDEEQRKPMQKELEESKARLEQLKFDVVLKREEFAFPLSHNKQLQNDTRSDLQKLKDKLVVDGTFKSLVKAKAKEEKQNLKITEEKKRSHTASRALEEAIDRHPDVYQLAQKLKTLEKEEREMLSIPLDMDYEISQLEEKIPGLEKEVSRINHDLEEARDEKIHKEDALKFYENNKDYIISRYASAEVGFEMMHTHARNYQGELVEPIYNKNITEWELESDPDPIKTYTEKYDQMCNITEEMKAMVF